MDTGPSPAYKTDWHFFKKDEDLAAHYNSVGMDPSKPDAAILVWWQERSDCFLVSDHSFYDGRLFDEEFTEVKIPRGAMWAYWPSPKR